MTSRGHQNNIKITFKCKHFSGLMSNTEYRTTALLTEHFGFPPLALVDDVINLVNQIMYKCIQAMETYLNERRQKEHPSHKDKDIFKGQQADGNEINGKEKGITEEEIQVGTAKLETLLENQVDKNFDKFELYALRNIFTIPAELVEGGWVRLMHHEAIDFNRFQQEELNRLDQEIEKLVKHIGFELQLRRIIKLQLAKGHKILLTLNRYKQSLAFLGSNTSQDKLSPEALASLKALSPLDESFYFLVTQLDDLISLVNKIHHKLYTSVSEGGVKDVSFSPSLRDRYIQNKTYKLLEESGVLDLDKGENLEQASLQNRFLEDIINVGISPDDVTNVRSMKDKLTMTSENSG